MPENNPFSTLPVGKPNTNLTAREKLFADMGLSPQGKPESVDVFAEEDNKFLEADFDLAPVETDNDDFISASKPEPISAAKEADEEVVDAIFSSTETAKPALQEAVSEDLALAFAEPKVEQTELPSVETTKYTSFDEPAINQTEATTAALKSLDRAGLDNVVDAYSDLQKKLAANQTLISAEREAIAELRNHIRQLNATDHEVAETSAGLDQSRKFIQADSCQNLLRSISQVNELIHQDSQRAAQLIKPIKAGVEVLELRVKHVNAIESLVEHMQEGLILQKQLTGADALVHDLAKHLGLSLN